MWGELVFFFFQAEDGIRDPLVTGVQTCALPILSTATVVCTQSGQLLGAVDGSYRFFRGIPFAEIGRGRVGKECRSRWWPYHEKKKRDKTIGVNEISIKMRERRQNASM